MKVNAQFSCGLIALALLFSGCQKKTTDPDEILYWQQDFLPGNFMINDTQLSLQKDASETDHTMDYVLKEALPDTSFRNYAIKLYVPTDPDEFQVIADSIFVWVNTGMGKRLINYSLQQGTSDNNGKEYAVFEINAVDSTIQGNPDNFQTVTFSLYCQYVNQSDDATKARRKVTADIYKKE